MFGLGKKRREELEDYQEDILENEEKLNLPARRKFRDLNPESRKRRKEPIKPWTKKERLLVLSLLALTIISSAIFGLLARDWKLPGLPKIKFSGLNLFSGEIVLVNNNKVKGQQLAGYEKVTKDFENITNDLSGVYGLYVYELNNGGEYGVNQDEIYEAASLIKLPVMIALYKKKPAGYKELVTRMGKKSDNEAFGTARKILGDKTINTVMTEIGMNNTSLEENETSLQDIGLFYRRLYRNELLPETETKEILASLTDTIYEEHLVKGIPEDIKVAHKYGREVHVVNDAGIVYVDNPYIVVIMTKGVIESEADEIFPELSKIIFDFESKN